jgi:UDP-glucose 4-epimerase
MAKIFITGVAGFLGSHLADAMLADGHKVVGVDSLIGGDLENVPSAVDFIAVDCNDFAQMRVLCDGCDVVYHCAATAYEGLSVFSPATVTRNIVGASVSVFSAAIAAGAKRIVNCSSMARYGNGTPPFRETDDVRPQDPYGIGKVAAENFLRNLCDTHRVQWVIAVPHNIIGPRQKYDDPYRNVASIMMNLCLQGRSPIIYGDGEQRRCFSYVTDCLQCLVKMAFEPLAVGRVINIGPDEGSVAINELFQKIANITGFNGPPKYMPDRPQEVKVATCSSNLARDLLDYKTQVTLDAGLRLMHMAMLETGPKPFKYHLPIEIQNHRTPRTWIERLF